MSTVTELEPWISVKDFAEHLGMSPRWIKYRVKDGMPSVMIGGRRRIKATEAERWLEEEGHLERSLYE